MKAIQLSQGKEAIVDDKFYDALIGMGQWGFKRNGASHSFPQPNGGYKQRYMQHVIMELAGCELNGLEVDHKDRDSLNNRLRNLRLATRKQNSYNQGIQKNNTTGFKGVSRFRDKYRASIRSDGKYLYLGLFDIALKAAKAYNKAAKRLHGQFAYLNDLWQTVAA